MKIEPVKCPRCGKEQDVSQVEAQFGNAVEGLFDSAEDDWVTVEYNCAGCDVTLDVKVRQEVDVIHTVESVELLKSLADHQYLSAPRDPETGRPMI